MLGFLMLRHTSVRTASSNKVPGFLNVFIVLSNSVRVRHSRVLISYLPNGRQYLLIHLVHRNRPLPAAVHVHVPRVVFFLFISFFFFFLIFIYLLFFPLFFSRTPPRGTSREIARYRSPPGTKCTYLQLYRVFSHERLILISRTACYRYVRTISYAFSDRTVVFSNFAHRVTVVLQLIA